jgi:hypothetical protein
MRHVADVWSFRGKISRVGYLLTGLVLFIIKYGLDLAVSMRFERDWSPLMYLSPRLHPLWAAGPMPRGYVAALLIVAAPFAWAGVSLSAARLRDMGVHPFWAGLFFLPFLHWAFFAVLAVAPSRQVSAPVEAHDPYRDMEPAPPSRSVSFLERVIPKTKTGAFLFGTMASLLLGVICFVISVKLDKNYGFTLFVGVPFAMGFICGFSTTVGTRAGLGASIGNALATQLVAVIILINLAWEGAACIVMALPIIGALTIAGAVAGYITARAPRTAHAVSLSVLALPAAVATEAYRQPEPVDLAVISEVHIAAPPEVVWKNVVSFPPIVAPAKPIFAIVAMPIEARIDGDGTSATRRCVFTNGTFVEPIHVWDAPRELTFGVSAQPSNLDPYIGVTKGQFALTRNPDGTTTLRGTTWYRLKVHPVGYWKRWTDTFLHAIHLRVLDHVKDISEHPDRPVASAPPIPKWIETAQSTCNCTSKPSH